MEQAVETVARVVTGLQECASFADLNANAHWGKPDDVVRIVQNKERFAVPSPVITATATILPAATTFTTTLREFLRLSFYELGIDIEFSGKGAHEKGVVIDMDEDKLATLGLKADALRFGQTVVRLVKLTVL